MTVKQYLKESETMIDAAGEIGVAPTQRIRFMLDVLRRQNDVLIMMHQAMRLALPAPDGLAVEVATTDMAGVLPPTS
jgi:hypothetical protein